MSDQPLESMYQIHEPIHGHCLCTAIRYTISFPTPESWPPKRYTCHCPQCRHQTGALFVSQVEASLDDIEFIDPSNHLREYVSSTNVRRGFCGKCGSVMYFKRLGNGHVEMNTGTLNDEVLRREGHVLAVPADGQLWWKDVISGVTDWKIEGSGKRWREDIDGQVAQ